MRLGTFTHQQRKLTAWLDDPSKRLTAKAEAQAFGLFERNQDKVSAWLLYHRVLCLIDGAGAQTEQFVQRCAKQFGPTFTPAVRLRLECDRLIGAARWSQLNYEHCAALVAAEQFMAQRDALFRSLGNESPNHEAFAHYAYGRALLAANMPVEVTHHYFNIADATWDGSHADEHKQRAVRNLIFLLRMAVEADNSGEMDAITVRLQRLSPKDWTAYGINLLHPTDGLTWFNRQDIRW